MKLAYLALLCTFLMVIPAHGSPTKGTLVMPTSIPPHSGVMYSGLDFKASETTSIDVTFIGGDIKCTVLDSKNNIVSRDECHVKFNPKKTSKFTLIVTNISDVQSNVTIVAQ
jgi:hypothetical protein